MVRSGPTFSKTGGVWIRHRIVAGLRHAVALLGQDVQQHRALLVLDLLQPVAQGRQVVAVDGADVAEAQLLEEHAAGQQRLEAVAHLVEGLVGHAADQRQWPGGCWSCRFESW